MNEDEGTHSISVDDYTERDKTGYTPADTDAIQLVYEVRLVKMHGITAGKCTVCDDWAHNEYWLRRVVPQVDGDLT